VPGPLRSRPGRLGRTQPDARRRACLGLRPRGRGSVRTIPDAARNEPPRHRGRQTDRRRFRCQVRTAHERRHPLRTSHYSATGTRGASAAGLGGMEDRSVPRPGARLRRGAEDRGVLKRTRRAAEVGRTAGREEGRRKAPHSRAVPGLRLAGHGRRRRPRLHEMARRLAASGPREIRRCQRRRERARHLQRPRNHAAHAAPRGRGDDHRGAFDRRQRGLHLRSPRILRTDSCAGGGNPPRRAPERMRRQRPRHRDRLSAPRDGKPRRVHLRRAIGTDRSHGGSSGPSRGTGRPNSAPTACATSPPP